MPSTTKVIYAVCTLCMTILCLQGVSIGTELRSITLAWDWYPGDSNYTVGPEGDIVFDIYLCDDNDTDCSDDDPVIGEIDDCWWDIDHYNCQATMEDEFEEGVYYFFAIAFLVNAPEQRSNPSNVARYVVSLSSYDAIQESISEGEDSPQESSSGSGCFIDSVLGVSEANRLRVGYR